MMKKLLLFALCLTATFITKAQTIYTYDFASSTAGSFVYPGTDNTATATAGTINTNITPNLVGPATSGGTVRIKQSTNTSNPKGALQIVSSASTSFGTNNNLRIDAPSGTSGQKFAITGWGSPTKYAVNKFKVKLEQGITGSFVFTMGNDAQGSSFSGTTNPSVGNAAGIKFVYPSSLEYLRTGNTYDPISTTLNSQTFAVGNEYTIAIYANSNSTQSVSYTVGSTTYSLAASSYQIFINGTRLFFAASNNNFPIGAITANADIDGFAYFGFSASTTTGLVRSVLIDDIEYGSYLATLPVSLTSFTAKPLSNVVQLNWTTASESNNSHFEIEKSTDGVIFNKIITKTGAGNSSQVLNYAANDNNPSNGTSYYRLVQYDFDGKQTIYDPKAVEFGFANDANTLTVYTNSNVNEVSFGINTQTDANGDFEIYNTNGQKMFSKKVSLNSGLNTLSVDANLSSGTYIATFKSDGIILRQKFVR